MKSSELMHAEGQRLCHLSDNYYFGGALIEAPRGELSTVRDLMGTKYTGNRQYNVGKK